MDLVFVGQFETNFRNEQFLLNANFIKINQRIVKVGKDFWRPSSQTPLPRQGHLEQMTQGLIQVGLEY